MQEQTFDIQELVRESGVPRRTIYFYVQQGLLPAPEGAGLAAYYTRRHLVRLKLIPILRRQGLRLDEIRQRFGQLSVDELEQLMAAQPSTGQTAQTGSESGAKAMVRLSEALPVYLPQAEAAIPGAVPMPSPFLPGREAAPAERHYIHYQLPAGLTLMAPDNLSQAEQQRLRQLLQAAAQIFSTSYFSE